MLNETFFCDFQTPCIWWKEEDIEVGEKLFRRLSHSFSIIDFFFFLCCSRIMHTVQKSPKMSHPNFHVKNVFQIFQFSRQKCWNQNFLFLAPKFKWWDILGGFLNSVREFLKGTAEMHLAKLLHHKSDFEVVPDIKETADKQMLPRMSWDLTSCPGLGTKSRQQISQWLKINKK